MQLRDTGTQRGLREGSSAAAVHGDPAHAIQAARNTAGERGDFYLFSPSSPGKSKPWPQLRTVRGLSGTDGLQCGGQAEMRLCWVNGMVFYRAEWAADLGASWAEALPEELPSRLELASRSVVFILTVSGSSSRDPPACLPACLLRGKQSGFQFLVKEDKTQADKRKRRHLSVRRRQLVYSHSLAEGRTRLSSWGLWSHHLYRGTDKGSTYSLCSAVRTGRWQQGGQSSAVPGSPQMFCSRCRHTHLTSSVLVARMGERGVKKGRKREVQGRRRKNQLQRHHLPGTLLHTVKVILPLLAVSALQGRAMPICLS